MSISWAIRRATGLTADIFKLKDRGYIKEGYYADPVSYTHLDVYKRQYYLFINRGRS